MKTTLDSSSAAATAAAYQQHLKDLDDDLRRAFPGCPVLIHAIIDDPKNAELKKELLTQLAEGKSGKITQQQLTEALLNHLPDVGRLVSVAAAFTGSVPGRGSEGGAMVALLTILHDMLNKEIHLFELNSKRPQGGIDHTPDSGLMTADPDHKFSEASWAKNYLPFVDEQGHIPATAWSMSRQVGTILDNAPDQAPGSRLKAGLILPAEHGVIAQLFAQEIDGKKVVVADELKDYLIHGTVPERLQKEQQHQLARAFELVGPTILPTLTGAVKGLAKDVWRLVTFQGSGDAVQGAKEALAGEGGKESITSDAVGQAMRGAGGAACPFLGAMQAAGPGAAAVDEAHVRELKKWALKIGGAAAVAVVGLLLMKPEIAELLARALFGSDLYGTPVMTALTQVGGGAGAVLASMIGFDVLANHRPERGES